MAGLMPALDDFTDEVMPASPAERCQDIYQRFSRDPDLLSIPVVADGVPLGLVHRADFMMRLAHSYGRALYGRKPVTVLMDVTPLVVERNTALEAVQAMIADSHPSALIKGFLITDGGRYVALGTSLSLIRHSLVQSEARSRELASALDVARSASEAKSAFLATMSHELRTPLNAVIGFAELIANRVHGELHEGYVGYAEDIREGGELLLAIISDVLDYAKIERGGVSVSASEFELDELIVGAVRVLSVQAERNGVILEARPCQCEFTLLADARLVRQMLMNLIGNAIKFTPEGGRVDVGCSIADDGRPCFSIRDTGCGMTDAELAMALEPFRQIDNGLSRHHEGTGLGLPLVKAFAEAHGGELRLRSARGAGTEATVFLPSRSLVGRPQASAA